MDSEDEASLYELRDRQRILDCVMRYSRGVDRCDAELAKSAYHLDALDHHGTLFVGNGHAFIDELVVSIRQRWVATQHHITNHYVEIEGDTAHGETYYVFFGRDAKNNTQWHSGRYIDRFERRQGRWAIAARVCVYEGGPDASLTASGLANHFNGARGRADISYQRPLGLPPSEDPPWPTSIRLPR